MDHKFLFGNGVFTLDSGEFFGADEIKSAFEKQSRVEVRFNIISSAGKTEKLFGQFSCLADL